MRSIGEIFVTIEGHDSGNVSYGVAVGAERWFVKHTEHAEGIGYLENAIRFHDAISHVAIIPVEGAFRTNHGLATVSPWRDGEILNDPFVPNGLPYRHARSTLSRFRALPAQEILAILDTIIDAHLEVTGRGFVAVDFYDGCILYDFARRVAHLCDLDLYRPGPFLLERDRQWGSRRFMAPEEFQRGAIIDERTTVFTLGRAAFVFLGDGPLGGTSRGQWRVEQELYDVAMRAIAPDPGDRFESVGAFAAAWGTARAAAMTMEPRTSASPGTADV